jgi:xanthine dehydrogenase accessory factor
VDEILHALRHLIEAERFGARITVVSDSGLGMTAVVDRDSGLAAGQLPEGIEPELLGDVGALIDRERSATLAYGPVEVFVDVVAPRPSLLVFGAVHIAQELCPMARRLGYAVTVSDARPAFTTRERFPDADRLLVGWPDALADDLRFDRRTFVVVLSHDARFEDPLWPMVLPQPVKYIGAMGSRKTAAARRERLLAAGFTTAEVEAIHGPIGLDIGAEAPAEIAVAILAEMTSVRYGAGEQAPLVGVPIRLGR